MPINLPMTKSSSPCGYFPDRLCTQIYTFDSLLKQEFGGEYNQTYLYGDLKQSGFCRFNDTFYINKCYGCNQCHAIRINPNKFTPSKSQRRIFRKNQDIEITLKNAGTEPDDEHAFLYREYEAYHNKDDKTYHKKTLEEAKRTLTEMNSGYAGIWNMEYRLAGRLIGVAIIDVTTGDKDELDGFCSNYFYYDTSEEISKRSLGTFSILQEIKTCLLMNIPYYYLGLYLPDCRKMNYKAKFQPCEILTEKGWTPYAQVKQSAYKTAADKTNLILLPPPGSYNPKFEDICFISDTIPINVLQSAYKQACFPWFSEDAGEPVVWRSPNPRFVIFPEDLHISKSIRKFLKHTPYTYTVDKCFNEVMTNCGTMKRKDQDGTWVGKKMLEAYNQLHKMGIAHSFEVWHNGKLAGGFYGELFGSLFVGESMFTLEPDSSKSAFVIFAQAFFAKGGRLIDCQAYTDNMARYGAKEIPRAQYQELLDKYANIDFNFNNFCSDVYDKTALQ